MSSNKNALIRYTTIDRCLQNRYRQWQLHELTEACSEALYEFEGRDIAVSRRTTQLDIQLMRSDKLGYNAPIEVYDRKYYRYAEPDYSITKVPLTDKDFNVLSESVAVLQQFKDFGLFAELGGVLQRLEDKVYTAQHQQPSLIHLDKNERLKGLHHLEPLYRALRQRVSLRVRYRSFKAREDNEHALQPLVLKEFNNRWFLVGNRLHHSPIVLTLALDRIVSFVVDHELPYPTVSFNADDYYRNTVGVTVLPDEHLADVVLKVDRGNAPYILTKPLHHSQQLLEHLPTGEVTVQLKVHLNYEFERLILGFGASMEVISPNRLRRRLKWMFKRAMENYQ